jgi:hypothetical protein
MSLIHTYELNRANPFDELVKQQRHHTEVVRSPGDRMPWNYRETLTRSAAPPATELIGYDPGLILLGEPSLLRARLPDGVSRSARGDGYDPAGRFGELPGGG